METRSIRQGMTWCWQGKNEMRVIKASFSGEERAKLFALYTIITLIDSDFNGKPIKYYTKTISTYSGLSVKFIPSGLKKLESVGLIKIEDQNRNTRGVFTGRLVTLLQVDAILSDRLLTANGLTANGLTANGQVPTLEDSIYIEDSTCIENSINDSCAFSMHDSDKLIKKEDIAEEYGFEEFWKFYPRNEGKKTAKAKFILVFKNTAISKRSELKKQIGKGLVANLVKYKKERGNDFHLPHATSWLNQERWNDYL